jgi:hypothetical protein
VVGCRSDEQKTVVRETAKMNLLFHSAFIALCLKTTKQNNTHRKQPLTPGTA